MTTYDDTLAGTGGQRLVLRIWGPVTLLFVASAVHTLAFPFTSEAMGYAIAGVVGLALVLTAILPTYADGRLEFDGRKVWYLVMLVATAIGFFFRIANEATVFEFVTSLIRVQTALAALIFFTSTRGTLAVRPAIVTYAAIVAIAVAMTASFGLYDYAGIARPYPFTGVGGVHPSAYAVAAALVGTIVFKMRGAIGWKLAMLLGAPLLGLLLAFQVRTTWMMMLAFVSVLLIAAIRRRVDQRAFSAMLGMSLAVIVIVVALLMVFGLGGFDLTTFSSGRTSVYVERLQLIAQRPWPEILFGTGVGSDSLRSATWWWEEKDSHNDFLRIVVEQGVICVVAVAAILIGSARRLTDTVQFAVFAALVSGSLLSNGLLDRPLLAVLFVSTLAIRDRRLDARGRMPGAGD